MSQSNAKKNFPSHENENENENEIVSVYFSPLSVPLYLGVSLWQCLSASLALSALVDATYSKLKINCIVWLLAAYLLDSDISVHICICIYIF